MPEGSQLATVYIGHAWTGFFSGTQAVLGAFVTELSLPDGALLKRRMALLMASQQACGIVVAPIAGSLARYGITIPFFVCAAALVLLFAAAVFREALDARGVPKEEQARMKEELLSKRKKGGKRPRLLGDRVIQLMVLVP